MPSFIGGLIADRYLGYIRSVFLGGCLMAAGYFGLSLPGVRTALNVERGMGLLRAALAGGGHARAQR